MAEAADAEKAAADALKASADNADVILCMPNLDTATTAEEVDKANKET